MTSHIELENSVTSIKNHCINSHQHYLNPHRCYLGVWEIEWKHYGNPGEGSK